ncbi:MAG: hypothetical protein K9N23_15650 [Akkermansiaceae bacterium]|nr:hypothetical protein [Akkermansiaceae bacterium]
MPEEEATNSIEDRFGEAAASVIAGGADAIDALANLSDDASADVFLQAVRDVNPGAIARRSLLSIDDVERFIWENCNELLSEEDQLEDWAPLARPAMRSGWLREQLQDELLDFERSLRDLKDAATDYGRFWKKNEGVGGFVARALKGYANPLDGWMHFVGKGSSQVEQDQLIEDLAAAFSEVSNAIETTIEEITLKTRQKLSSIKTDYYANNQG